MKLEREVFDGRDPDWVRKTLDRDLAIIRELREKNERMLSALQEIAALDNSDDYWDFERAQEIANKALETGKP